MNLFDVQHPFFIPLWRRIAVVVACLGWAGFELASGNPFWAILFGAIGLWCAHQFFIAFDPKDPNPKDQVQDDPSDQP